MNPLKGLGNHRLDPKKAGSLGCPVTGGSHAVVFAAYHNQVRALLAVGHAGIVNVGRGAVLGRFWVFENGDFLISEVGGVTTFGPGNHEVLDPDIAEGPAGHDAVISST